MTFGQSKAFALEKQLTDFSCVWKHMKNNILAVLFVFKHWPIKRKCRQINGINAITWRTILNNKKSIYLADTTGSSHVSQLTQLDAKVYISKLAAAF